MPLFNGQFDWNNTNNPTVYRLQDPLGPFKAVGSFVGNAQQYQNQADQQNYDARAGLAGQSQAAGQFANQAQGNYGQMTGQLGGALDYYRGQMQGQNSVAAEQLRQGLAQNLAAQQSMAASASPNNSAMAARTAAMNMGRLGYGMSGQQALAGLQERNQAAQNYGQLGLGMRGQDVSAALGARQAAIGGYGQQVQNPQPSWIQKNMPWIQGVGTAIAAM